MDIQITPFQIKKHYPLSNTILYKPQNNNTFYTTPTILPNYQQISSRITFGNSISKYTPEDFLLPANCSPDIYQTEAADALKRGDNTIVTAPTGTGKTAIAYYIINKNMKENKRTFYTTPLKALSNQKYNDLKKIFGEENVGILTGDRKENAKAPIVIMTTEIYRNMVASNYFEKRTPQLDNLETVIFDEFHYMGDPTRGNVWEESIMYTPGKTQILALSATVGNNEKITTWIKDKKTKPTTLIDVPITNRHVPLNFSIINPTDYDYDIDEEEDGEDSSDANRKNPAAVINVLNNLNEEDKLPAIVFVFSKTYVQDLLDTAVGFGEDLTTQKEKRQIREILEKYMTEKDFYSTNLDTEALYKGYATHSAAILPTQKQLIEELFNKKLIKVVFATETLAAGINMPARTVVMTDSEKPGSIPIGNNSLSEESHMRPLMPNEFHQMSGRAGRRGIDNVGYVVLLADTKDKRKTFKSLIKSEPNSIDSSYKTDASNVTEFYNTTSSRDWFKHILDKTFSLYGLEQAEYDKKFASHMKDFDDYSKLLADYKFLSEEKDGYSTTPIGLLISKIKGRPQIPILETILKKQYDKITPENLAGIMAAIAVPPGYIDKAKSIEDFSQKISKLELKSLNTKIDKILEDELKISPVKLNSSANNDIILNFVEQRCKNLITEDIAGLIKQQTETEENLQKKLKQSEENWTEEIAAEISKLYKNQARIERMVNISKSYKELKSLLDEKLEVMISQPEITNSTINSEFFNNIQKIYDKYNYKIAALDNENIPPAMLNQTAMVFVRKWAELNNNSDDYVKNWNTMCKMLQSQGSIKYEGDLFNAIAQTIDFLHQFRAVTEELAETSKKPENKSSYETLAKKCKQAEILLKQPPLFYENN